MKAVDVLRTNPRNYLALFLRLALAFVMFPHGAQKALGWFGGGGWSATIEGFSMMGIPALFTVLAILAEFAGSIGLFFGFLTRIAALGIAINMIVAVFLVHWPYGFFMNWQGQKQGEGFEYHILAIALAVALIVRGGGAVSVDAALGKSSS